MIPAADVICTKWLIGLAGTCVLGLTVIEITALTLGINGVLMSATVGAITGCLTLTIGYLRGRRLI